MSVEFDLRDLEKFLKSMVLDVQEKNPEIIEKHLKEMQDVVYEDIKKNVNKLLKENPNSDEPEKYMNRIYKTKVYKNKKENNLLTVGIVTNAKHAAYLEYGFRARGKTKVKAKRIFKKALNKFKRSKFDKITFKLMQELVEKGIIDVSKFN